LNSDPVGRDSYRGTQDRCRPRDNDNVSKSVKAAGNLSEPTDKFRGFPEEGIRFLRELKKHNDRDWFRDRKHLYQEHVEQPMAMLVTETASICRQHGLKLVANEKNPVMRVYRDIRFSADKRPYKTHVGAALHGVKGKGGLYMHISPEESFVAAGFWMPERPFLQAWRTAMVADPNVFLRLVKSLDKRDLALSEEDRLSRLPRGFDNQTQSEIAEFLKLTSYVVDRKLQPEEYRSPALIKVVTHFALATKPMLEFGWDLNYLAKRDILEER
jgi:uncharacterized protein (TIGR02453 family)